MCGWRARLGLPVVLLVLAGACGGPGGPDVTVSGAEGLGDAEELGACQPTDAVVSRLPPWEVFGWADRWWWVAEYVPADGVVAEEFREFRVAAVSGRDAATGEPVAASVADSNPIRPELVARELAGGAAILMGLSDPPRGRYAALEGAPLVFLVASVRDDGRALFIGNCALQFTGALEEFAGREGRPAAELLAEMAADPDGEVSVRFRAGPPQEPPVAWIDRPPDERVVDPDTTPPEIYEQLHRVLVVVELPGWLYEWDRSLCGRSPVGRSHCAYFGSGMAGDPIDVIVFRWPGDPIELWVTPTGRPQTHPLARRVMFLPSPGEEARLRVDLRVRPGIRSVAQAQRAVDAGHPLFEHHPNPPVRGR